MAGRRYAANPVNNRISSQCVEANRGERQEVQVDDGKVLKKSMQYLEEIGLANNSHVEACVALDIRKAFAAGYRRGYQEGKADATKKHSPPPDEGAQ